MANNLLKRNAYARKAKEKKAGFYANVYEGQQVFNERVEAKQQCLPGVFIIERIISSRGRDKVGILNLFQLFEIESYSILTTTNIIK